MTAEILLDTPEKTISLDGERGVATIIDRYKSIFDGSQVTSTSYFSLSGITFYEGREEMSFTLSYVPNVEVLHYMLKALGIENYTWLRFGYRGNERNRINLTFTDEADYAFFKFNFFDRIK
jgi:hypothetical protein